MFFPGCEECTVMIHDNLPSLILQERHISQLMTPPPSSPEEKRFAAKSCPSALLLARGPIWKYHHPNDACTWQHKHTFPLQRHCQTAVEAGTRSAGKLSCLGQSAGFIILAPAKWADRLVAGCENGILIFRPHIGYYPDMLSKYTGWISCTNLPWRAEAANRQLDRSATDKHVHSHNLCRYEMDGDAPTSGMCRGGTPSLRPGWVQCGTGSRLAGWFHKPVGGKPSCWGGREKYQEVQGYIRHPQANRRIYKEQCGSATAFKMTSNWCSVWFNMHDLLFSTIMVQKVQRQSTIMTSRAQIIPLSFPDFYTLILPKMHFRRFGCA